MSFFFNSLFSSPLFTKCFLLIIFLSDAHFLHGLSDGLHSSFPKPEELDESDEKLELVDFPGFSEPYPDLDGDEEEGR